MVHFHTESPTGRRWYHWYSPEDTPEERRLIRKLDLLIVPYAFVLHWVKYMDQSNLSEYTPWRRRRDTNSSLLHTDSFYVKTTPTYQACPRNSTFMVTSSFSCIPSL